MKKIGFIDYYLDEWHANNFPRWIRESSFAGKMDVALAWAEKDGEGGLTSEQWCSQHGVELARSLEDLVQRADYLVILSPDNPERHEDLSALALTSGKPVFIDKTFAPDLPAAKRMFARAADHGTPMFSSSALRFAEEFERAKAEAERVHYVGTGGPGAFNTYGVHQLEMIVSLIGVGAGRVMQAGNSRVPLLVIDYADGRRARLEMVPGVPFSAAIQHGEGRGWNAASVAGFFPRSIEAMLTFFETGEPPVAKEETLEIAALLDAGKLALDRPDDWVNVAS